MIAPDRPAASLARNVSWSGLAQVWSLGLSLLSVLVLSRLLGPEDFAVLAVVIPVVGLVQFVQTLGLNSAIVQSDTVSKSQLNSLFLIVFGVSLAMSLVLLLLAQPVAALVRDPRLVSALGLMAIVPPIYALAAQPHGLLLRALRFKAMALTQMLAFGLTTATSIVGAWLTGSYWALIAAQIVSPVIIASAYIAIARWRPGRPGPFADVRTLLSFGLNVWAANLFNYVSRNADNLIVAYAATPRQLGLYDRSYRALLYPLNQAVNPLGAVLVPTLTRCLDDTGRYLSHYWRAIAVLLIVCQPVLLIAVFNPETVVGALLGPEWLEASILFAWFAGAGLFQTFQATLSWLLLSQGRASELMRMNLVISLVALTSFLIGIGSGIEGLARAYVLGQGLLCLPYGMWLVGRSGPVRLSGLLVGLAPHCIATLAVALLVMGSQNVLGIMLWPKLIATTVLAYALYVAVLLALPQSRQLIAGLAERGGIALAKAARRLR